MIKGNQGFRLKYRSRYFLDKIITRFGGNAIYDISGPSSQKGKHALVIYSAEAVSKHLSKTLHDFPSLHDHSGFAESIALLNLLLDAGFVVDYADIKSPPRIEWSKYELIIDGGNNLEYAPFVRGQKRVYYATSCHWRTFYENAYRHTDSFLRRHQTLLYPDRIIQHNYSDDAADVITCFGGSYQAASFGENVSKVRQISISTTHLPPGGYTKSVGKCDNFIWYAGYGPFHKGLDIVVEAFSLMPRKTLHIFGNIETNGRLYEWFRKMNALHPNLKYHGWARPESEKFAKILSVADALICASSSEGGAGAVVQCMQMGLLPVVNRTTALDIPHDLFQIHGTEPEEQIRSIVDQVQRMEKYDRHVLQEYSDRLRLHYCKSNTIETYRQTLKAALELR